MNQSVTFKILNFRNTITEQFSTEVNSLQNLQDRCLISSAGNTISGGYYSKFFFSLTDVQIIGNQKYLCRNQCTYHHRKKGFQHSYTVPVYLSK